MDECVAAAKSFTFTADPTSVLYPIPWLEMADRLHLVSKRWRKPALLQAIAISLRIIFMCNCSALRGKGSKEEGRLRSVLILAGGTGSRGSEVCGAGCLPRGLQPSEGGEGLCKL